MNFEHLDEFNNAYLKLKLINSQPVDYAAKKKALDEAHDYLDKFAVYQRRTA